MKRIHPSSSSHPTRRAAILVGTLLAVALMAPAVTAQATVAGVEFPELVRDLGAVNRGERISTEFEVRSTGSGTLELGPIRADCACATIDAPETLAPGASGTVRVEIDTEKLTGPSTAKVMVSTNDPANPLVRLTVKVESVMVLAAHPGYFRYIVFQGFEGSGKVTQTIFTTDGRDFEVTGIESPNDHLVVSEPRPATDEERQERYSGSQWSFDSFLQSDAPVGALTGYVRVFTNHPSQKVMPIPLSGFVRPTFALTPETFELGTFTPSSGGSYRDMNVQQFTGIEMELRELTSDLDFVTLSQKEIAPGREWSIRALIDADAPKGPFSGTVTLLTTSSEHPKVEIPISGEVQ